MLPPQAESDYETESLVSSLPSPCVKDAPPEESSPSRTPEEKVIDYPIAPALGPPLPSMADAIAEALFQPSPADAANSAGHDDQNPQKNIIKEPIETTTPERPVDLLTTMAPPGANPLGHTKPSVTNAQPPIRCDNLDTHVHVAPFQSDLAPETIQHMNDSVPRRVENQKELHAAVARLEDPFPPNAN